MLAVPAPAPADGSRPQLPDLHDTKITLPWDDFKRLVESTIKPEKEPVEVPAEYSLDRASYQVEARKGFVLVKSQITVNVLEPEQWVTVPLLSGVAVTDVRNLQGTLTVDGGSYQLLLHGAGPRTFELDFTVKGTDHPGQNELSFQVPEAAVSYIRIAASGEVEKVESEELIGMIAEASGKSVMGAIPQGGEVSLTYDLPLPKETAATGVQEVKQEPKVFVEEKTLATVGEGLMTLHSIYDYQILLAPVTTFRFKVPEGVDVLEVSGNNLVEGFKILKVSETERQLEVRASFEVKGAYQVIVSYEKDLGGTDVKADLALLEPVGVERATGVVGLEAEANAEVKPLETEHMVPVDVTEVPREVWTIADNPLLLGFRYLERPMRLQLQITKHEDQAVMVAACDSAFVTTLVTDDGSRLTRALYTLRNNRKQFLKVKLPEGAEVWSAFIRDKAVKPAKGEKEEAGMLLIPLPRSGDTTAQAATVGGEQSFPLEVVYFVKGAEVSRGLGTLSETTPVIDVPVSQLGLSVYLPVKRSYHYLSGTLRPESDFAYTYPTGGILDKVLPQVSYRAAEPATTAMPSAPPPAAAAPSAESGVAGGNDDFAQQQMQQDQEFKARVKRKAYAGAETAGSLPVRISFPEQGENLRFRKLLAMGDAASVRIFFVHGSALGFLALIVRLLGLVSGVAVIRILARRFATGAFRFGRAGASVVATIAIVTVLALLLDMDPAAAIRAAMLSGFLYGVVAIGKAIRMAFAARRARNAPQPPSAPPPPPVAPPVEPPPATPPPPETVAE
ncbi:MAG: hypothetical protein U0166_15385 [Acidobacteriota bacterium]